MSESIKRENRYLVLKWKNIRKLKRVYQERLEIILEKIRSEFVDLGIPEQRHVVVDDDWPEYEVVWEMIEARIDPNRSASLTPAEAADHWRKRYLEQKQFADELFSRINLTSIPPDPSP